MSRQAAQKPPDDQRSARWATLFVLFTGTMISRYPVMSRYGFKGFVVGMLVSFVAAGGTRLLEDRHR